MNVINGNNVLSISRKKCVHKKYEVVALAREQIEFVSALEWNEYL